MRKKRALFLSSIIAFTMLACVYGCGTFGSSGLSEGIIEYEITYPKMDPNNMMVNGLPSRAYLRFKDNNMSNDMSGMMGLISITYISNAQNKGVEQRLTLFNNKYASTISPADLEKMNSSYVVSVEDGKKTAEIAKFKCKESIVKLANGEKISVYSTNDISIENPNWSNPYKQIDGVLMDFEMEKYGVVMHLKATSVLSQKVEDEAFTIPADSSEYKIIDIHALEDIMRELNPAGN